MGYRAITIDRANRTTDERRRDGVTPPCSRCGLLVSRHRTTITPPCSPPTTRARDVFVLARESGATQHVTSRRSRSQAITRIAQYINISHRGHDIVGQLTILP